ncbi:hypothetical protein HG530_008909 [Fusarium avenaceum]|nr:hypothetical protein HG530_008909 [Fusarium avenaceum]
MEPGLDKRYQALRSEIEVKVSSMITSGIGSRAGKEVSTEGKRSFNLDKSIEKGTDGGFGRAAVGSSDASTLVEVSNTSAPVSDVTSWNDKALSETFRITGSTGETLWVLLAISSNNSTSSETLFDGCRSGAGLVSGCKAGLGSPSGEPGRPSSSLGRGLMLLCERAGSGRCQTSAAFSFSERTGDGVLVATRPIIGRSPSPRLIAESPLSSFRTRAISNVGVRPHESTDGDGNLEPAGLPPIGRKPGLLPQRGLLSLPASAQPPQASSSSFHGVLAGETRCELPEWSAVKCACGGGAGRSIFGGESLVQGEPHGSSILGERTCRAANDGICREI